MKTEQCFFNIIVQYRAVTILGYCVSFDLGVAHLLSSYASALVFFLLAPLTCLFLIRPLDFLFPQNLPWFGAF